jgi:hypothetical protein
MTHDRFMQILEAYGADPQRWPADERDAASSFAKLHPELITSALKLEHELDTLLGAADVEPGDLLQARIMRHFPVPAASWSWRAPIATAAALLIGVALGFTSGDLTRTTDGSETLYADAFSGLDDDWVDWMEAET